MGIDSKREKAIFVTGATGSLGIPLVRELIRKGYDVRALVRNKKKRRLLPDKITCIFGELPSMGSLGSALNDVGCIVHLAAVVPGNEANDDYQAYYRVNVEGTINLAKAALEAKVKRFIYVSTIGVYGESDLKDIDENSPLRPESIYALTKLQGEKELLSVVRKVDYGIEYVILRMSTIYGPNMKRNFPKMARWLSKGFFPMIGSGRANKTLIYEKDAVKAIILACESQKAASSIFNVTDGNVHTVGDIVDAICKALRKKPFIIKIPEQVAAHFASTVDGGLKILGRPPMFMEYIKKITGNISVKGERFINEIGFQPDFDLIRGWEETIVYWMEQGII
uniref:NAD-dependent epimerase/dehydratase family protein n=1 Tax=candidate division WOR-3 bacterium TaxID=2052148 RepID=A0A7V3NV65_UNCW3